MHKIVIATKNKSKVEEIKKILSDLPVEVVSMLEEGIDIAVIESGRTFEENSLIKARAVKDLTPAIVMADDSGLEVDCLGGAPGIYSSRFAGEDSSDEENIQKLLEMMKEVKEEERAARFVCAISVILPDDSNLTLRGECEGMIGFEPVGQHGFGYDPLFYIPEHRVTMAQVAPDMKNNISHRAKALEKMKEALRKIL